MRRLENSDEEKFWEAWIKDETVFMYRFGKIGTQGQTRLKRHATKDEADADLEDNVARKLKEGFEEKSEDEEEKKEEGEEEEETEESDSDDEDSDDEEDEEEAPKKKKAAAKHIAAVPAAAPSKPALVARTRAAPHKVAPEQISAAKNALEALHGALGKRSWKVRKLARRARQSLERVAGIDPAKHGIGDAFDALMQDVVAPKKRLPLEIATGLLLELDAAVFVRTVKQWKSAAANSGGAKEAIGALAASVDAIHDADVALHVGAALAERKLDASSWRKRFHRVKPALEDALKKNGSTLAKYLKSLDASDDTLLAARIEEAAR